MSVATPAARLLSRNFPAANSARSIWPRHSFHASAFMAASHKSAAKSGSKKTRPLSPRKRASLKKKALPDITDSQLESMKMSYTPQQLRAVELGEKLVDKDDLLDQGRLRKDPHMIDYLDDFSMIHAGVDKRVKSQRPVDTSAKFMTPDQFSNDLVNYVRETNRARGVSNELTYEEALQMFEDIRSKMLKDGSQKVPSVAELAECMDKIIGNKDKTDTVKISDLEAFKYLTERNSMTGFDGGDTALAPELPPKIPGVEGSATQMDEVDERLDPSGVYHDLRKRTGWTTNLILEYFHKRTKILVRRFVTNQTRLGKIRSTYILAMTGDGNGRLGLGEAKSVDGATAQLKAKLKSIENMVPIRRYENRTIYGNVEAKVGATVVQMYSRPPGFGLRVSHRMFEIARLVGITDLAAKMPRARNPMNSCKAAFEALRSQPDPEIIALGRSRKLVDARKVYYGGAVF